MASPLPVLKYLVAFQNGPLDDPALITTVATPAGTLGANNVWTDITPYVDSHQISRGRQHELAQFEAGTLQLHLNNVDARFNPWNTSSPYTGFLVPRKLVQVRATWAGVTYTRFTGHVDAWPVEWPDPVSGWASLHATDAFRLLNLGTVTSTGYESNVIVYHLPHGGGNYAADEFWELGDPSGSAWAANTVAAGSPATVQAGGGSIVFGQTGGLVADAATSVAVTAPANHTGTPTFAASGVRIPGGFATCELWVQIPSSATIHVGGHIAWFNTVNSANYQLQWEINNGTLKFTDVGGGGNHSFTTSIADGNWHMLDVIVDDTWSVQVWVDAVQIGTFTMPAFTAVASQGTTDLYVFTTAGSPETANLQFWSLSGGDGTIGLSVRYTAATLPQQATDARIGRMLDAAGWSSTARNLDAGTSTVQAVTSSLTTTSTLAHMQQVEGTESGALYMTTDGLVRFVSRQTLLGNSLYTTSQQTIGDNLAGGDMPFQPGPVIALDDIDLYNEATAARTGGATQRATDTTSITNYGRTTWQPAATLVGISDSEVLGLTQYVVNKYAAPVVRIQAVTVDLLELITPNLVAHLFTLDLLQRITVERTSTPGGGTGFSQVCNIEHVDEQVTPDSWTVTFGLAIADPGWWILGTSQLGTATRLAF